MPIAINSIHCYIPEHSDKALIKHVALHFGDRKCHSDGSHK